MLNIKKPKKSKIIFLSTILFGIFSIAAASIAVPLALNNSKLSSSNNIYSNSDKFSVTNSNEDVNQFANVAKPLVPSYTNYVNRLVSTSLGPIVHYNNFIVSLDWFGAQRWKVDMEPYAPNNNINLARGWNRAWLNMALDRQNNVLWISTNASNAWDRPFYKQRLLKINVEDGTVTAIGEIPGSEKDLLYNISFLDSGKVMIFDNRKPTFTPFAKIYDPKTGQFSTLTGNSGNNSMISIPTAYPDSKLFFANLVPIAQNLNIAYAFNFPSVSGSGDSGASSGTSNIYFLLVDDKLNRVDNTANSKWNKAVLAVEGLRGYRNTKIWPSLDYYKLINGKTVCVIFNTLVVIDPGDGAPANVSFKTHPLGDQWVSSWSFDTNENLFFKYQNDSKIYKLENVNASTASFYIYYDLSSSPFEQIKKNANSLYIYAVYGYAGSLMLINSFFSELIEPSNWPTADQIQTNLYGLCAGIVQNVADAKVGDTKGLLNTADAYQFSSDFTIDNTVLAKKLPSEITQNDLTLLNQSFFTRNTTLNASGELMYPGFIKSNVNDEAGSFTIDVNLDQIPWFTSVLPTNFIPLKLSKVFNTVEKISARVSWKDVNSDYNFKNTLPTKVDATDLKRFDPFLIDLASQRIVDNTTQAQIYPTKTYSTTTKNDSTGSITIQCIYKYMPLGVTTLDSNAKTFTTSQSFTIFKDSDNKVFNWLVAGSGTDSNNIKLIPSLKMLSESNLLPSSIDGTDTSKFLPFINVNTSSGYPLSKMTFTLVPNDRTGELTITAVLPASYYGTEQKFTQKYIGLNKKSDYGFKYKKPSYLNQIMGSGLAENNSNPRFQYNKMLPTDVTQEMVYLDFVSYSGYNDLDLEINFNPNNNSGELEIIFTLDSNYPSSLGDNVNTFVLEKDKYISKIKLGGFLTQAAYYKQYSLTFKNDNDTSLNNIKNIEINVILNSIKSSTGFVLDGVTYKSLEELVELFISFKGTSIPQIKSSNISVYPDNSSGTLTFELMFPTFETGYGSNLIFSKVFTGFVKGVEKPTGDSFIFKNQDNLDQTLLAKLPSEIKRELTSNKLLVKNYFVNFLLGEFTSLITNVNAFQLVIDANDVYGTLSIGVIFEKGLVTNKETLTTYSIEYVGFQKVS